MARTSWLDDKAEHPLIQERVQQLDTFTSALADGGRGTLQARMTALKQIVKGL